MHNAAEHAETHATLEPSNLSIQKFAGQKLRYPPAVDLASQREIWSLSSDLATSRGVAPHSPAPVTRSRPRPLPEPAWGARELPPNVWDCMVKRGELLQAYEVADDGRVRRGVGLVDDVERASGGCEKGGRRHRGADGAMESALIAARAASAGSGIDDATFARGRGGNAAAQALQTDEAYRPEEATRPPRGSGYTYPGRGGARPTLAERLGAAGRQGSGSAPASPGHCGLGSAAGDATTHAERIGSRRERIEVLEQSLHRHEEERMTELGRGTTPLLGLRGELVLPTPPLEAPRDSRLKLDFRLKLARGARKNVEAALRTHIHGAKLLGEEPCFDHIVAKGALSIGDQHLPRAAGTLASFLTGAEELAAIARGGPGATVTSDTDVNGGGVVAAGGTDPIARRRELAGLKRCDAEELLREAENLIHQGASEDQWARLASQLCARAYEARPPDVLRMVRALGSAACGAASCTAAGKSELHRAADHLIQTLTLNLQDASVEFLVEVIETMSFARVGSQAYLDLIIALLLARHHRDYQALNIRAALRLATAFGQVGSTLRLRPKGVGGASTATNCRLVEALEKRIAEGLDECEAKDLARIDDYWLTRLCGDAARRAIVNKMATMELGLRGATTHHLPAMINLQESIQRELGEGFTWSMPRQARDYLRQLQVLGAREKTPWVLGERPATTECRLRRMNMSAGVALTARG
eukprot:TRINITY_DN69905_c0_g1_i1.p1 TRINITY_DN69905_c0_g1~~TRINITY_DN69905_c0_g1_i1.p1  ORF type:complete len:704 (-),score=132.69 TRINITY_DN69905_c0_g1_i1:99-2210(-)